MSKHNGTGNGHDHDTEREDNIVRMPTLAERDKMRREAEKEARRLYAQQNPAINLPPATKGMLAFFIAIHLIIAFWPAAELWAITNLGFIPGAFTGHAPFSALSLITPLSHMTLHGGWLHLGMNMVMLAAFGTGVERWIGPRSMILFFVICGLCGIALHFLIYLTSTTPVIGASGGLSGFFAAALAMMNRLNNNPQARKQLLYAAGIYIAISVMFAFTSGPGGSNIAWAAHVGGFLGGFAAIRLLKL